MKLAGHFKALGGPDVSQAWSKAMDLLDTADWNHPICSQPLVNFINILRADFEPKSFRQKVAKPYRNYRKASQSTFIYKKAS